MLILVLLFVCVFVVLKQLFELRRCGCCVLDNDDPGCRSSRIRELTSSALQLGSGIPAYNKRLLSWTGREKPRDWRKFPQVAGHTTHT